MRVELKDFSGGITDFIYTDDLTSSELMDNIVITKDKSMESRPGSRVIANHSSKPTTSIIRPQEIIDFNNQQFIIYGGEILRYDNGTWEKILGPNSVQKPLNHATINSAYSYYTHNKHLVITDGSGSKTIKLYKNNLGAFKLLSAGLPKLHSAPTVTSLAANGKSYLYTFVYYNDYNVENDLFVDISSLVTVQVTNASDFSGLGVSITSIPVLSNTADTQYDVNNLKVKIYRTVDTGTTSYLVGTVSNGTTNYTDNTDDETLITGAVLYTDGGIAENDEPPIAKHIEICNSCGYYANSPGYSYRLYQSQIGDFDSVPAANFLDFEEEILGLSNYQSNLVVFTENKIWRVEGVIELDGGGSQRRVEVEGRVGFIGGIVRADGGVYFAGHDSFYWTDGYQVKKIPSVDKNIPERYREFSANGTSISGAFDRINQRIYWAVKISSTNYKIYVYDMAYNALTTWSGVDGSFNSISLMCTKSGDLYRGDSEGYIFKFDSSHLDDSIIDQTLPVDQWENYPVVYRWKHVALDYGASDVNKWVMKVTLSGNGETNLDLQINSYDDSIILPKTLTPISFKSGLVWGDETWTWGNHDDVWGLEQRFIQTRKFKSGKIRCKRKQLEVTNAVINIAQSYTDLPDSRVSVNSTLKTATVINSSLIYIPQDSVGDLIYINNVAFEIIDVGSDTFRLKDDTFKLVDGIYDWYIKGLAQRQRLHLSSVIYTYDLLDDRGGYYSTKGGDNA